MALPDLDSSVGASFGLELDGATVRPLIKVSGLAIRQEVIKVKQQTADGRFVVKSVPGGLKGGQLTVVRPLTTDTALQDWAKNGIGQPGVDPTRHEVAIVVHDLAGATIRRFVITNPVPVSLTIGSRRVGDDTTVLTEALVIGHDGITAG